VSFFYIIYFFIRKEKSVRPTVPHSLRGKILARRCAAKAEDTGLPLQSRPFPSHGSPDGPELNRPRRNNGLASRAAPAAVLRERKQQLADKQLCLFLALLS
jgi:hypothetical protein